MIKLSDIKSTPLEIPQHECNEDGNILILSDGSRVENTKENREMHKKETVGGSICCSICGRAAIEINKFLV